MSGYAHGFSNGDALIVYNIGTHIIVYNIGTHVIVYHRVHTLCKREIKTHKYNKQTPDTLIVYIDTYMKISVSSKEYRPTYDLYVIIDALIKHEDTRLIQGIQTHL